MVSHPYVSGSQILQLTADHRIDGNIFEQARVTEAGGVVSTVDKSGAQELPWLEESITLCHPSHRLEGSNDMVKISRGPTTQSAIWVVAYGGGSLRSNILRAGCIWSLLSRALY